MQSYTKSLIVGLFLVFCSLNTKAGKSTRYWDCCKPSCSWPGKASYKGQPVQTCAADGKTALDPNTKSGCDGGSAFMCANQQPWAVNDTVAYGFAAGNVKGSNEAGWCCACYEISFTSGPVTDKKMVVQVTNTGSDLGDDHFDIQIPGGGVGIFNGCKAQYNAPADGWGQRYGGVSSRADCAQLPADLRPGCQFRFDWFRNADNPSFNMRRVKCPKEITDRTKCIRSDE